MSEGYQNRIKSEKYTRYMPEGKLKKQHTVNICKP